MYEEGNKKINSNWISLAIKLILLALFIFILVWVFSKNGNNTKPNVITENSANYVNNIGVMKTAAQEYFIDSKLPTKVGETEKLTLSQMINQKLLIDFTDDGKSCDLTNSYVQATKTSDENFALKVSLKCDKKSDFIVTTIEKKCAVPGNSCKEEIKKDPIVDKLPNSNGGSNSNSSSNNGSNQNSNVTTTVKTTIKITITCPNCNDVTPDPTPDPKPDKVLYYKYVKYGEWLDGYKNGSQYENNCTNTIYYDYCKEHTNTYYTSSYIDAKRANNTKYTYTIKLDNISNYRTKENTVGVSNKSYFSPNLTDYIAYLNTRDENITMIGANQKYNVYPNSIYDFKNSSLDIDNFTFNVSGAYKNGNAYFVDVTINYKNGNGIIPYNAKNIGYNVYFVPLKFNVSYSTNSDCIRDTELNKWKYNGYSVSNPSYETGCHHREIFYKWSTEKSLAGYTYTGISEYR